MPYQLFVSLQAPAFSMWELYFIHYQPFKYNQMKLLFATLCVIASISGSYLSLTAPSITQLLIGVVFILLSIICLLLLIIKDGRQEIDFWKSMKGFIFVITLTSLFTACSGPNKLKCPKDTSWETSRRHNLR